MIGAKMEADPAYYKQRKNGSKIRGGFPLHTNRWQLPAFGFCDSMRMTWIKKKLPWYIIKFCKITSTEISLRDTSIFIGVNFGKSCIPHCYIKITPKDIGWR